MNMRERLLFGAAAVAVVGAFAALIWYGGERLRGRDPFAPPVAEAGDGEAKLYVLAMCPDSVLTSLQAALPAEIRDGESGRKHGCLMVSYLDTVYFSDASVGEEQPREFHFHLFTFNPNGSGGMPAWQYHTSLGPRLDSDWCVYATQQNSNAIVGWDC